MSELIYSPRTDYNERILNALLDSENFLDFRDYYLRQGLVYQSYKYSKDVEELKNYVDTFAFKKNTPSEYIEKLKNVFIVDESGKVKGIETLHNLVRTAQNNTELTPYERVGMINTSIKELNIKVRSHSEYRMILESILVDWTIRDLKRNKEPVVVDNMLDSVQRIVSLKDKHPYTRWIQLWNTAKDSHIEITKDIESKPKFDIKTQNVRNELRQHMKLGEHLIFTRLFQNGILPNRFSSNHWENFMEQSYVLCSTPETFDKKFFSEWLAGRKWSTEENKDKYEEFKKEHTQQWLKLVSTIVNQELSYLVPMLVPEYAHKYGGDLKSGTRIDYTDTSKFKSRVINFEDLPKKLLNDVLEKHPVFAIYRHLITIADTHEIKTKIIEQYPQLKTALELMDSLSVDDNSSISEMESYWHLDEMSFNYILNEKTEELKLPELMVATERDYLM